MKYNGAILWNSITDLIDHKCSFNTFKFNLKQYNYIKELIIIL